MSHIPYARIFPLLFCIIALSSCKRDTEEEEEDHAATTVDLRLAFVFKHGTHGYELASEYVDDFGHVYKLDGIRFLLSDLYVVDDGSAVLASYPGVQLLVDAAQPVNDFALGTLTASHAHQIRFTMGLNHPLNHADPDTCAAPLSDASMHWGMTEEEGFWFLVLEGHVDSDNSGTIDGSDTPFTYRCGTDALVRNGWARMHTELPGGGTFTIETDVDVERLMGGLDILNNASALGDTPLNVQLMDSLDANFHESH